LKSVETTNISSLLFKGVGPTHPTGLLQISGWDFTCRNWNVSVSKMLTCSV